MKKAVFSAFFILEPLLHFIHISEFHVCLIKDEVAVTIIKGINDIIRFLLMSGAKGMMLCREKIHLNM